MKQNPDGDITDDHLSALAGDVEKSKQLAAYVSAVEKIELKIQALGKEKHRLYLEMKALHFCKDTIRKIALQRIRNKDRRESENALLRLYEDIVETQKKD